ncbi:MAG: hypothetical protein U0401_11070 [Anaerolineae bacterium]
MTPKNSNLRFMLICLTLFAVGALLRIQSGWMVLPQAAAAQNLAISAELSAESQAQLRAIVLNFYHAVDKGRYTEAADLSFETRWQKLADKSYTPIGLTSPDEFSQLLSDEIGSNGGGLNIISIEVRRETPVPAEQWSAAKRPELMTLHFLPPDAPLTGIYEIEVGGVLLGRCSRWDWDDKVLVAHIGDQWRLLLPGSPDIISPHHEEWFLDRNSLKGKVINQPGQQT